MIDSACFWASEYKLGGFRFDLMGLHDLDTMDKLAANLHQNVSEYVTVYGEPWSGGTSTMSDSISAKQANLSKYGEYGCFNDKMRDGLIKGGLNSADKKGWITATNFAKKTILRSKFESLKGTIYVCNEDGSFTLVADDAEFDAFTTYYVLDPTKVASNMTDIINGISGRVLTTYSNDPSQCVNYVTCHDNYTLYDRIKATGTTHEGTIKDMAMLANSVVFTSQGISFMLAGEELLRTKNGNSNSYNASYEINELDYALKVKHLDMFANYQKLIALKKSGTVFSLDKEACEALNTAITVSEDSGMISYKITSGSKEYYIVHANGIMAEDTDRTVDLTGYSVYLDTIGTYEAGHTFDGSVVVGQYQSIIAYKNL